MKHGGCTFLRNAFPGRTIASLLVLFLVLICQPSYAQPIVVAGSDYLQTVAGTSFNFTGIPTPFPNLGIPVGDLGNVAFKGNPTGPGNTDTVVQRKEDADLNSGSGTIEIELVSLSLVSTDPVYIPSVDSFFDVFVELNLDFPNLNQGQMTITGNATGGTFDSFFDVFVDITIDDGFGQSDTLPLDLGTLSTPESQPWSPDPPSLAILVEGLVGDFDANFHTDLAVDELDFFPGAIFGTDEFVPIVEEHPFAGLHVAQLATVPEPGTFVLLGLGVGLIGLWRRRENRNSFTRGRG